MDPREEQAVRFERIAEELESATMHCRTTARHFREGEIPRAGAHALAVHGHLLRARSLFEEAALDHAGHSRAT